MVHRDQEEFLERLVMLDRLGIQDHGVNQATMVLPASRVNRAHQEAQEL